MPAAPATCPNNIFYAIFSDSNGGVYPPNGKWKSHENITYVWKHVYRGSTRQPHRIQVYANLVQQRESLPQDPLTKSAPKDLFFTAALW